jgi:glycosyltransferase involved in cell wall biosynthesis
LRTNPNLVYLLAGTGVLQERIQQLCEERKLSDRIRVLGWVTYERMPELMNSADVVLMASESEGFSRAYLEAMACERLLLASDIPPARDLIRDGQNGLLFRMGDIEHMTARTLEAAADPGWREAVGRRARISMEHLSIDSIAPIYLEEFASLLRDRRTAP